MPVSLGRPGEVSVVHQAHTRRRKTAPVTRWRCPNSSPTVANPTPLITPCEGREALLERRDQGQRVPVPAVLAIEGTRLARRKHHLDGSLPSTDYLSPS